MVLCGAVGGIGGPWHPLLLIYFGLLNYASLTFLPIIPSP